MIILRFLRYYFTLFYYDYLKVLMILFYVVLL